MTRSGAGQAVSQTGARLTLKSGTYEVGPGEGTLLIRTKREGAAAKMGHDLTIAATTWRATVTLDAEQLSRSSLRATIDAASLTVREGSGGAVALTTKQHGEIEKNICDKVLKTAKYPQITFQSTAIEGDPAQPTVTGDLTITGVTRQVTLQLAVHDGADTVRVSGLTRLCRATSASSRTPRSWARSR